MTSRDRVPGWAYATVLAGTMAFTFGGLLSATDVPIYRDLLFFFIPFKHFLSEHLRAGEIPLWNPWIQAGVPFLGGLQTGVFYPPSLFLLLPFPLGFNLFILGHYAIAAAGAFFLLHERGLTRGAAAIGVLTFVLGGFLVSMLNVLNHLQAVAWAPWVFLAWARALRRASPAWLAATVLAVALQILGGSPEILLLTLAIVAAWTVQAASSSRAIARATLALGGAVILALGLTAFQLLPTFAYVLQSSRGDALIQARVMEWSLEPVSLLQLLIPHSTFLVGDAEARSLGQSLSGWLPWVHTIYLGIAPLCLAIAGVVIGRERVFWALVLLTAGIFALGSHTPVLPALYDLAPGVIGKFRFPEKFLFAAHFAATILAAEGAERFLGGDRRARRLVAISAITLALAPAAIYAIGSFQPVRLIWITAALRSDIVPLEELIPLATDLFYKSYRALLLVGTLVVVVFLSGRGLLRPALTAALLFFLVAVDLGAIHRNLNMSVPWTTFASQDPYVDVEALRRTQQRVYHYRKRADAGRPFPGLGRYLPRYSTNDDLVSRFQELWRGLFNNAVMVYGVGSLRGMDGITRASTDRLTETLRTLPEEKAIHLLRLYGTAYLIGEDPLVSPLLTEERALEGNVPRSCCRVYRIRDPLPFAFLVGRMATTESEKEAFDLLLGPRQPSGKTAVVEKIPDGWTDHTRNGAGGTARVTEFGTDGIRIAVESPETAAFLVVNAAWDPGWVARVDGVEMPIHRTNVVMSGIVTPPGRHEVELAYEPRSLHIGTWISLASFAALVAIVLGGRRRSRP